MIQLLANRYRKITAYLLLLVFELAFSQNVRAAGQKTPYEGRGGHAPFFTTPFSLNKAVAASAAMSQNMLPGGHLIVIPDPASVSLPGKGLMAAMAGTKRNMPAISRMSTLHPIVTGSTKKASIGGPNQPEMSSFKSVDAKNLVNLFSGDFSYNIPLLDVDGYPINLFYNGAVGPEQEASWVGLGWNVNPGNVTRNMRGVPDDFDGTGGDVMTQTQNMKPNNTWGVSLGADLEGIGIKNFPGKLGLGLTLGASFNNYLGVALDLGVKEGLNFKLADNASSEKNPASLNIGMQEDLNSRSGLSFSPSASLTANAAMNDRTLSVGLGISTSYNSRSGIKGIQLNEQVSVERTHNEYDFSKLSQKNPDPKVSQYRSTAGANLWSVTLSHARPSYVPAIRIPMHNKAISGKFQLGGAIFGVYGSAEVEAYQQTSSIPASKIVQQKPMVGYFYADKAMNNPNAVMDFTRFNDREVTPNTSVISAPQYTYDVFYIQGEETGGSIRAYRKDLGFVRDNSTGSDDESTGVGVDIGIPGHYGANYQTVKTPTTSGEWGANNSLHANIPFQSSASATGSLENLYFRNPGEAGMLDPSELNRIGGTDLVRYELSGTSHDPGVSTTLDRFNSAGYQTGTASVVAAAPTARKKRTQVIDFLTANDATQFGLDKTIHNYDNQTILDPTSHQLIYTTIPRVSDYRLGHHISEINVTESDGKRYIYGIPVYNTIQQDFTFTVNESTLASAGTTDQLNYAETENNATTNPAVNGGTGSRDGYVQITQTPAYAHSFLLSGLLSPDYQDRTGDGITDDDPGTAVKFNYTEIVNGASSPTKGHGWRTPIAKDMANFNAGHRTEVRDDKGIVSYGEREAWYLHSIESKNLVAIFTLGDRNDNKGVIDYNGGLNTNDVTSKCLTRIDLYNKADLKKNGLTGTSKAKPIKTVTFNYSYALMPGAPDNAQGGGRLTLESIDFTFNGQARAKPTRYKFSYLDNSGNGNPAYAVNTTDRWGTYKPASMNPGQLLNSDFPFTPQEQAGQSVSPKAQLDQNAGAWSLKKILLPSGGQIEVGYESDDYGYVQNLHAMDMMTVAGFGSTPSAFSNRLYDLSWTGLVENNYLFIKVPVSCANAGEVQQRYLQGVSQLAVQLGVDMPAGIEKITSFATVASYGVYDASTIWVQMKPVGGMSPLSVTAIEFLREQLPGQAFPGYDVSNEGGLESVATALGGMLDALKSAFSDPINHLRSKGLAQTVELGQSFARLNDADGMKYGGGQRVKYVKLKDNWQAMTQQYTSVYQQTYDYTTTETFNGATRVISSGVASYEPGIGGEENPFDTVLQVSDKLPLGPTSYGSIEMPVMEAFFPSPSVGYSKVTVRSVPTVTPNGTNKKTRSGVGRQVTEYYTAKDYPSTYSYTNLDPSTDKEEHDASVGSFFYMYAFDSRALSQGFLAVTNDMHGKMKSQASYADNDTTLKVNYTEYFYKNTGSNGLNETFDFVSSAQNGQVSSGNMGVDVELMTDTREFTVSSSSLDVEAQVDLFPVLFPIWIPFIWPVVASSNNNYRAVTATKTVAYHSILDSVAAYDKGSLVSTKNLVYDAETGSLIVSRTNNEFDQPIYNTVYPAWWAYSGMGPAYRNTEMTFTNVACTDGVPTGTGFDPTLLESGDELLVIGQTLSNSICPPASSAQPKLWVIDKNKGSGPFPIVAPSYIFIDTAGNPVTINGLNLRLIRSGKRNMLNAQAATVMSMVNPVVSSGSTRQLSLTASSQVLNANASEYSEKWQEDNDMMVRSDYYADGGDCSVITSHQSCTGASLLKGINPYTNGLLGNFQPSRTMVFYGNRTESDPTVATNLATNGTLANFVLYWDFSSNQLAPSSSALWVEKEKTTRLNRKGLQLETKNALGIYTSAQYGFSKTLPTAIVNNAPEDQMIYEGFEDYSYDQTIDPQTSLCTYKKFDFGSLANSKVIMTDSMSFTAHTGKYVLGINPNTTATATVPVAGTENNIYSLQYAPQSTPALVNVGLNSSFSPTYPNTSYYSAAPTVAQNTSFNYLYETVSIPTAMTSAGAGISTIHYSWSGYINVPAAGAYNIQYNLLSDVGTTPGNYDFYTSVSLNDISTYQTPIPSMVLENAWLSSATSKPQSKNGNTTVTLCKGIYAISVSGYFQCTNGSATMGLRSQTATMSMFCASLPAVVYANTNGGCTSTAPIAGSSAMINPDFSMAASQPMVLSAWVKEAIPAAASGASTTDTYANNSISINTGSGAKTFKPAGPIIDGWQRYEVTFTPSSTATTIGLVNSGPNMIYFDDIRIHPFNAEMKSYVYDPINMRLIAELDENNYATFYEYDEEGTLVRNKAETSRGIKTIQESRSAKQKNITDFQ